MSKITQSELSKKEVNKMFELFYIKVNSLKTRQETADFLSDVLTESEKIMILRRLQIAKLLLNGDTYYEIRNKLNVGSDTIKTVRYKIDNGSGGYINFIKNFKIKI